MDKQNENINEKKEQPVNEKTQEEKLKTATPVEPYQGNSKLTDNERLTPSGMKPE